KYSNKTCCRRAYLRGAFLAGGSINNPETSSYHLEIFNTHQEHNAGLHELLNDFDLRAREIERKNGYMVYMKEAEKITEFISIIGAYYVLYKYEYDRIVRNIRNSINRQIKCETANLNKTIDESFRQIESIQLIDKEIGLHARKDKLRKITILRVRHQDVSLK